MSLTQQALAVRLVVSTLPLRRGWLAGLQGPELTWAIAFAVPYVLVFLAFVLYPICQGLYLGGPPQPAATAPSVSQVWQAIRQSCDGGTCSSFST